MLVLSWVSYILASSTRANQFILSPSWNLYARNRLSSSQKLPQCSSGDGYLTVLEESLFYYLDLWVWAPQYWFSDILRLFGQWYCRGAFKASSMAASVSTLSSAQLERSEYSRISPGVSKTIIVEVSSNQFIYLSELWHWSSVKRFDQHGRRSLYDAIYVELWRDDRV